MALRVTIDALDKVEVDVVDRLAVAEAVDQIKRRAADAFDRRQIQFHRTRGNLHRLRAQFESAFERFLRILDSERHAARRRTMFGREIRADALGLTVHDKVDVALAIQRHVFRPVIGDLVESQHLEYRLDDVRRGGCEFDELEPHESHRILE